MEIYNIEIVERLDETSGVDVQDLEMNCSYNVGTEVYEFSLTGTAFMDTVVCEGDNITPPHSEVQNVTVMLNEHYVYHHGFNVPLFNTDIDEDQLEELLRKHCT